MAKVTKTEDLRCRGWCKSTATQKGQHVFSKPRIPMQFITYDDGRKTVSCDKLERSGNCSAIEDTVIGCGVLTIRDSCYNIDTGALPFPYARRRRA